MVVSSHLHLLFLQGIITSGHYKPSQKWQLRIADGKQHFLLANDSSRLTTRVKNKNGRFFEDCLDYVFYRGFSKSKDNKIYSCPEEYLPCSTEGSDHIPVSCTLFF